MLLEKTSFVDRRHLTAKQIKKMRREVFHVSHVIEALQCIKIIEHSNALVFEWNVFNCFAEVKEVKLYSTNSVLIACFLF